MNTPSIIEQITALADAAMQLSNSDMIEKLADTDSYTYRRATKDEGIEAYKTEHEATHQADRDAAIAGYQDASEIAQNAVETLIDLGFTPSYCLPYYLCLTLDSPRIRIKILYHGSGGYGREALFQASTDKRRTGYAVGPNFRMQIVQRVEKLRAKVADQARWQREAEAATAKNQATAARLGLTYQHGSFYAEVASRQVRVYVGQDDSIKVSVHQTTTYSDFVSLDTIGTILALIDSDTAARVAAE